MERSKSKKTNNLGMDCGLLLTRTKLALQARSQNFEKRALASSCLSFCPHGKIRLHWTDIYEILYLSICRKFVEKYQVSLKSDKNNWYVS
jgi:hypothetical protein